MSAALWGRLGAARGVCLNRRVMKTDVNIRPFTETAPAAFSREQFAEEFGIPESACEEFIRLAVLNDSFAYDAQTDVFSEKVPREDYAPWVRGLLNYNRARQRAAAV